MIIAVMGKERGRMSGKCRPLLRQKTLENVKKSILMQADKNCIQAVFERFEQQQAEIERLNKLCLEQNEEIRRLNALTINNILLLEDITLIKAEAVKEFAERLKEFKLYVGNSQGVFITDEDIDNLLKEKIGEEK